MAGRILVIDDSTEVQGFFTSVLGAQGYELLPALDGEEGLVRFRDELPDLVFVDLVLPRRSGEDVCLEIKSTDHGLITPIVVMTGLNKSISKVEAMRSLGAVDFLTKPMPVAKIAHLAEWILGGKTDDDVIPAADPELDRFELGEGAEGVMPLNDSGLLVALRLVGEERLTGTIVAARGRHRRALALEEGRIVGARSNAPADRVDRILVAMRRASPAQVSSLRDRLVAAGADPFAVLREAGILVPGDRESVLRYLAMTVALTMFRWNEGTLRLIEGEMLPCPRLDRPIPPSRLLLLGLRKSREARARAIEPFLADPSVVMRPAPEEAHELAQSALTRAEREVFSLIDGKRTIAEVRGIGRLAQIRADDVVAILAGAGLVEAATRSNPGAASAAGITRPVLASSRIAGDLSERLLVEVLGSLLRAGATGILSVESRSRRQFALEDGELVFARSSDPGDRFGQVLLSERRIDPEALERALQIQREHSPDRRLGSILVDLGVLSLSGLDECMRQQIVRIVEATYGWTEGAFVFEPGERGLGGSLRLGLDLLDLLRLGAGRADLPFLRRRWLGGEDVACVTRTEAGAEGLALAAIEMTTLDLAQGETPIEDLVAVQGRDTAVLRAVLLLSSLGLVDVVRRERKGAPTRFQEAVDMPTLPCVITQEAAPAGPPGGLEPQDTLEIPMIVLEPDPVRPAEAQAATTAAPGTPSEPSGASLERILGFLRDELVVRRDALAMAEELGRLRERVRMLEEEIVRLRTAPGAAAAARPGDASRGRARKKKGELEPVGVAE